MTVAGLLRASAVILALLAGTAHDASGQVWLPPAGDGSISITYQALFSRNHLDSVGKPYDKGQITNLALVASGEFAPNDRITLDGSLAVVAGKHQGADRLHGPLDTGVYHGAVQDARLALRVRLASRAGFALTPFIGAVIPTHDYETRGHSAPGRHLRALQVGAGVARDLGPVLSKAYVQALYSFAFVERVGGMSINRTNVDIETGYALTRYVTVTLGGALQRTHGGVIFPLSQHYHGEEFQQINPFHDRVARANHFLMSSGATVPVRGPISLFGNVIWMISGQNTHSVKGFAVGTSWSFSRGVTLGGQASRAEPAVGASLKDARSRWSLPAVGSGR